MTEATTREGSRRLSNGGLNLTTSPDHQQRNSNNAEGGSGGGGGSRTPTTQQPRQQPMIANARSVSLVSVSSEGSNGTTRAASSSGAAAAAAVGGSAGGEMTSPANNREQLRTLGGGPHPSHVVDRAEMMALTNDVKHFKEALGRLRKVFPPSSSGSGESGSTTGEKAPSSTLMTHGEPFRFSCHERLSELLKILRIILEKYPALQSNDLVQAASSLISQVKEITDNNASEEIDEREFHMGLDSLALAFSNRVSEYLTGDMEGGATANAQQQQKSGGEQDSSSASHLTAAGSGDLFRLDPIDYESGRRLVPQATDGVNVPGGGGGQTPTQSVPGSAGSTAGGQSPYSMLTLNPEQIDSLLMSQYQGVDLALKCAKKWAKYAKDVMNYVEKRTHLELEWARGLTKLAQTMRPVLREESFLPFQSVYCTALDQDLEYCASTQATCSLLNGYKFLEPLFQRRQEHQKTRKNLKDQWTRELKRMQETVSNLDKAKSLYMERKKDHERCREAVRIAEHGAELGATGESKVDSRKRKEDEALAKTQEAESVYRACVVEANDRHRHLLAVKKDVLGRIRNLIVECDVTMKTVTVAYFHLQHTLNRDAPVQFQTLCEKSRLYEPGSQFVEFIQSRLNSGGPGSVSVSGSVGGLGGLGSPNLSTAASVLSQQLKAQQEHLQQPSSSASSHSKLHHPHHQQSKSEGHQHHHPAHHNPGSGGGKQNQLTTNDPFNFEPYSSSSEEHLLYERQLGAVSRGHPGDHPGSGGGHHLHSSHQHPGGRKSFDYAGDSGAVGAGGIAGGNSGATSTEDFILGTYKFKGDKSSAGWAPSMGPIEPSDDTDTDDNISESVKSRDNSPSASPSVPSRKLPHQSGSSAAAGGGSGSGAGASHDEVDDIHPPPYTGGSRDSTVGLGIDSETIARFFEDGGSRHRGRGGLSGGALVLRSNEVTLASRTHRFRKLKTPGKCRECDSYIIMQGYDCFDCGLSAHKKCLEICPFVCSYKRWPRKISTFSVDLGQHLLESGMPIPLLVMRCIQEIDTRGIRSKGIYRTSGVKNKVDRLSAAFEQAPELVELSEFQPNVLANVLKLYIRQLPEPLLTYALYPEFIRLAQNYPVSADDPQNYDATKEEAAVKELTDIVHKLPGHHYKTLAFLIHHLRRVSAESDVNNMTASNLAIVFGPTLMRPKESNPFLTGSQIPGMPGGAGMGGSGGAPGLSTSFSGPSGGGSIAIPGGASSSGSSGGGSAPLSGSIPSSASTSIASASLSSLADTDHQTRTIELLQLHADVIFGNQESVLPKDFDRFVQSAWECSFRMGVTKRKENNKKNYNSTLYVFSNEVTLQMENECIEQYRKMRSGLIPGGDEDLREASGGNSGNRGTIMERESNEDSYEDDEDAEAIPAEWLQGPEPSSSSSVIPHFSSSKAKKSPHLNRSDPPPKIIKANLKGFTGLEGVTPERLSTQDSVETSKGLAKQVSSENAMGNNPNPGQATTPPIQDQQQQQAGGGSAPSGGKLSNASLGGNSGGGRKSVPHDKHQNPSKHSESLFAKVGKAAKKHSLDNDDIYPSSAAATANNNNAEKGKQGLGSSSTTSNQHQQLQLSTSTSLQHPSLSERLSASSSENHHGHPQQHLNLGKQNKSSSQSSSRLDTVDGGGGGSSSASSSTMITATSSASVRSLSTTAIPSTLPATVTTNIVGGGRTSLTIGIGGGGNNNGGGGASSSSGASAGGRSSSLSEEQHHIQQQSSSTSLTVAEQKRKFLASSVSSESHLKHLGQTSTQSQQQHKYSSQSSSSSAGEIGPTTSITNMEDNRVKIQVSSGGGGGKSGVTKQQGQTIVKQSSVDKDD